MVKRTLQTLLLKLESELEAQGHSIQALLSYLADVNEAEIRRLKEAPKLDLLMIFGGDDLIGLRTIFARYFDELRHKGLRTIVITGGIGRLTTTLLKAVLAEQETAEHSSLTTLKNGETTQIGFGSTQRFLGREKLKAVKDPPLDLDATKESLASYVSEADMYLELFLNEWLQRGFDPDEIEIVGYDDYLRDTNNRFLLDRSKTEIAYALCSERIERIAEARRQRKLLIFVEGVSTNTGNNTSYSLEMLRSAGFICEQEDARQLARRTAIYQQPALQLRTKYTVERQFGAMPLSASYAPDDQNLSLQDRATLILLIAGEYARLASYCRSPYNFFRQPDAFDSEIVEFFHEHSALLENLCSKVAVDLSNVETCAISS